MKDGVIMVTDNMRYVPSFLQHEHNRTTPSSKEVNLAFKDKTIPTLPKSITSEYSVSP